MPLRRSAAFALVAALTCASACTDDQADPPSEQSPSSGAAGATGAAGSGGAAASPGAGGAAGQALSDPLEGAAVAIYAAPAHAPALTDLASLTPLPGLAVAADADPARFLALEGAATRVAVVQDDARCGECFRIDGGAGRFTVSAGGLLGAQYGVAALLEQLGLRFFHPERSLVPSQLSTPSQTGVDHAPLMPTRGLHLHTLHPVEGYYAMWEPGDGNLELAHRTIDWLVKNRGNYLQWVALDQVTRDAEGAKAWRAHTRKVLDMAHARGVKVGIGIQLFGTSSLQKGFILLKSANVSDARDQIREQLHALLDGLPFDTLSLSFGEFSKVAPERFIERVNDARAVLAEVAPEMQMAATIHVGGEDLRIDYMGESLLYYFLVKFADPSIVPWVHTVMFYDLYESAGGAYKHENFFEHRDFLEQRLSAKQPAVYHPESAYWIAFDNAVPTYLPLYLRSRQLDLAQLKARVGDLSTMGHVLFTSGWEWGYWQHDYANLRGCYELPARYEDELSSMFAPYGEAGAALAGHVAELAELQHQRLLEGRLAAYYAGRDDLIDLGDKNGTVAAPDRVLFEEVLAMTPAELDAFDESVAKPLEAFAEQTEALSQAVEAMALPDEPFLGEVVDGFAIDAKRARFVATAYRAAVNKARSGNDAGKVPDLDWLIADGRQITLRRAQGFHSKLLGARLYADDDPNQTLYRYGYLRDAQALCFWERERAQLRNLVLGESNKIPPCVL